MTFIDNKEKLERLDQLIRLKATGSPDELASRFNSSKRTICRTIKELKEIGCPIYFSKELNSYCYEYPGKLLIKFETLDNSGLDKIKGGLSKKIFTMPNNGNETNYICTEKQINSFSGFPTPDIEVGFKYFL